MSPSITQSPANEFIFVVGVGRSGTSLVQSILACQPNVYFLPETSLLRRLLLTTRACPKIKAATLPAFWQRLTNDSRFNRLNNVSIEKIKNLVSDNGGEIETWKIYEFLMHDESNGEEYLGDKDPRLVEYLQYIHLHRPGAYVVNVVRDPRDILVSKRKADWSKNHSTVYHLLVNWVQYRVAQKYGKRLFGDRFVEVYYEELLQDERGVVKNICTVLGLEFSEEMLNFSDASKRLVSDDEMQWKQETLGPLLTGNHGKWQSELSDWDVLLTETACRDAVSANRFCMPAIPRQSYTFLQKSAAKLIAFIVHLVGRVYLMIRALHFFRYRMTRRY